VGRVLEELLTQLLSYSQRKREETIFKIWVIGTAGAPELSIFITAIASGNLKEEISAGANTTLEVKPMKK
jgi:hypothetical protein